MKKINISRRRALLILVALLVVSTLAVTIFGLFETKGLRTRVHTLEYAQGEEQRQVEEQNKKYEQEKVNIEVVSKEVRELRFEDHEAQAQAYPDTKPQPVYTAKKFLVVRVKITNNTSYVYDSTQSQIRGKTNAGTLVDSSYDVIHPDDSPGQNSVILAPGGAAEIFLFFPADRGIIDVIDSSGII